MLDAIVFLLSINEEKQRFPAKIITQSTESFARFQQEIQRSDMLISSLEAGNKLILKNSDEAKQVFMTMPTILKLRKKA